MKSKWQQLALREKQMLVLGGIVMILAMFYGFIWAPLANKVSSLRADVQHNQQLLSFMQAASKKIQSFSGANRDALNNPSHASLLSGVQQQLHQPPLSQYPVLLKQADSDSVEVSFKQVNFDLLMTWLIRVSEQNHWVVKQMTITQSTALGVVATTFILTSA